jgi:hypothetical protein
MNEERYTRFTKEIAESLRETAGSFAYLRALEMKERNKSNIRLWSSVLRELDKLMKEKDASTKL